MTDTTQKNNNDNYPMLLPNKKSFILLALLSFITFSQLSHALQTPLQWQFKQLPAKVSLRGSAIKEHSLWVTGANNTVFVSQDGGISWQDKSVKSSIITDFRDIALFDSQTAIIMGAGSGELSVLYKTSDGGNSWQPMYQTPHKQGFFDSIAFWDEKQGLLMGDPIDGYFVIKKTTDGGKTWQRIKHSNIPALQEKEVAFAASGNTLIIGKQGKAWFATGGFSAWVYHSNDYGETWQRRSVPIHKASQTSGVYALALNSNNEVFALGGDYLARSANYSNMASIKNNSWQSVNNDQRGLRTAMACQQAICISTGKLSTDVSYDHGNSWQALSVPSNSQNSIKPIKSPLSKSLNNGFYTIASDNNTFIAAGAKGNIAVISLPVKE
ncbi:YCF48-related protein [Colwellia sp. RSH04]|uniref:YCF48-related protein n=1 Tax=Colwellia sp. RSH04 TaxID=2305464 RepID=UPI000E56971D|nr:YCF48-related protein [Colwellia sp. RSH04]RHW75520.1 oxidoreductase [Colwellia sp. RSH04]